MQQQREGGLTKSAITQLQAGRESQDLSYPNADEKTTSKGRTTAQAE